MPVVHGHAVPCTHTLTGKILAIYSGMSIFISNKINALLLFLQKCVGSPYKRHHDDLKDHAQIDPSVSTRARVLFVCATPKHTEFVLKTIRRYYPDSMKFWLAYEAQFIELSAFSGIWRTAGDEGLNLI